MTGLWFGDLDADRRRTVTDDAGRPVAHVSRGVHRRYEAHTPDGRLVVRGRPRAFRRRYDVVDAAGRPLAQVRTSMVSARRRTVRLGDGRRLRTRDVAWPRHLQVTDGAGTVVMTVEATGTSWTSSAVVARPASPGWNLELGLAVVVGGWGEADRPKVADWS